MGMTSPVAYGVAMIDDGAWWATYYVFTGLIPLLGVCAWLLGLLLHGLGRSTAVALGFTVFAIGDAMGATFASAVGMTQQAPDLGMVASAAIAIAIPLLFVVGLAMFGRRRAAGLLLAGAALPWTAWWAMYLVDIALGAPWEPLQTVALFLAGVGPLLLGVAIAAAGDPVPTPDPWAPPGRPGSRRPLSLGRRLFGEAQYGLVGPSIVFALVGATAAGLALPGFTPAQVVVAVLAAVVGTEIELRWIQPRVRPALEAYHWVGRSELARFRAATGQPVPTSMGAFRSWLARTPETDATRPYRVEMLTVLDRFDEAQAELDRIAPSVTLDGLKRETLAQELAWRQGAPADVASLVTTASAIGPADDPERLAADGLVAWWSSQVALAALDPSWRNPLAAYRGRLGAAAAGLHARSMRLRTLIVPLVLAVGLVGLNQLGR
jgi:hypothetical protein